MMQGVRLTPGQSWSLKWPGHVECGNGTLRRPYMWKGKVVNRYVLEKQCSYCQVLHLQDRNNARKAKHAFCSAECRARHTSAKTKGSRFIKKRDHGRGHHILVKAPGHHRASRQGCVYEHILVAEETIGRPILGHERVHHINCIKSDNRPENLFVCSSDKEHFLIHGTLNHCVAELFLMGVLEFDTETKSYKVNRS
jgi:hypothetical protein